MSENKLELEYGMSLTDESRDMLGNGIRETFLSRVGLPRMSAQHKFQLADLIEESFPEETLEDIRERVEKRNKNPLLIGNLPELSEEELPSMDIRNELIRAGMGPEPSDLIMGFVMEGLMQHFDMRVNQRISRGRTYDKVEQDHPEADGIIVSHGEKFKVRVPGQFRHKESPTGEDLLIMLATPRNTEQAGTHFYDLQGAMEALSEAEIESIRLRPMNADPDEDVDVPLSQALVDPKNHRVLEALKKRSDPKALEKFEKELDDNKVSHSLQRGEMLVWNDGQIYHSADLGQSIQDYSRARLLLHFNGLESGMSM